MTNLQRQALFDEEDAAAGAAKAVAAARRLVASTRRSRIEPVVADVWAGNIEGFMDVGGAGPVDLILDGTDNVATRYLVNDVAVKHGVPWVYGACVGTEGRVMAIRPGRTACLRCVFPTPPPAGELPTCDTAGVLGPAAAVVASLQVTAAIKLLTGALDASSAALQSVDVWTAERRIALRLADAATRRLPVLRPAANSISSRPGGPIPPSRSAAATRCRCRPGGQWTPDRLRPAATAG